jgi:hypothetical protein
MRNLNITHPRIIAPLLRLNLALDEPEGQGGPCSQGKQREMALLEAQTQTCQ